MAENKVSANGVSAPSSKCDISGCYKHFESMTNSKDKKTEIVVNYKFRVHFRNEKEITDHAVESMQRVVAYKARMGKPIHAPENKEVIDIYHDASVATSFERRLAEIEAMTLEELDAAAAQAQMILDAARKRQSVASVGKK